jgi:hypothetical protein
VSGRLDLCSGVACELSSSGPGMAAAPLHSASATLLLGRWVGLVEPRRFLPPHCSPLRTAVLLRAG